MSSVTHFAPSRHIRAVPATTDAAGTAHNTGHGIAYVWRSRFSSQAMCTCGAWSGPPRLLTARATQDAQMHAVESGCEMPSPKVAPRGTRRFAC